MTYSQAFENAVAHVMIYEVGGFVDITSQGFIDGTDSRASGYTNDPNDAGGETKYGISKRNNPTLDVTNLNWAGAQDIYYQNYWLPSKCDQLPGCVAALQFDGAINNGIGTSAKFLQRAVGVADDGAIGPGTLAAVAQMDPIALCNAICDQRTTHYNQIVAANPGDQEYLAGWLRRVNEMRAFTTNPNGNF